MLGSLTFYRKLLHQTLFSPSRMAATPSSLARPDNSLTPSQIHKLPTIGHALAGVMAGATVSFIAAPVEHLKARLQIQYSSKKSERLSTAHVKFTDIMVYQVSTMVFLLHFSSVPFSSFGGVLTTFSHVCCPKKHN